jgi:hypothetical protein
MVFPLADWLPHCPLTKVELKSETEHALSA